MLTVPEVARRVGVHPETVRRWIWSGRLRARKVGTQHVIAEEDLDMIGPTPATRQAMRWDRWFAELDDVELTDEERSAASRALAEIIRADRER